jgi:hypothetical protein
VATKKKRKPSRAVHPLVVKAGLAGDPVFGKYGPDHEIGEGTRIWMEERREEVCAACGEKWWTGPRNIPICGSCWSQVPHKGRMWWWTSKKTAKSLARFVDTYFEAAA